MAETLNVVDRGPVGDTGPLADLDWVFFSSRLVRIGSFRCPTHHPRFSDTGPPESHLVVFPRSSVWITHEGGAPFVGDPTHAALYNPGQAYTRGQISPDGDRSDWFAIAPALLRELSADLDASMGDAETVEFREVQRPALGHLYRLQRTVFEYVSDVAAADVMAVEETVIRILRELLEGWEHRDALPMSRRRRELVEDAKAYLALRSCRSESLVEVARKLECSVFHLCRVFRAGTGTSLHRYRQRLRVRKALEHVIEHGGDLLTLGLSLGFSGHSHFTAAFKREFGILPSVLRTRSKADLRRLLDDTRDDPPSPGRVT